MVDNNTIRLINEIKEYASRNNVPIMMDGGINFVTTFIIKEHVQKILEVGTAIGYSAIMMALTNSKVTVTTIERDKDRYLEAVKNIKKLRLEDRITLIFNDAKDVVLDEKYDLIVIDAAKAQNINFFKQFQKYLVSGGTIITDNMNFHGLVNEDIETIKSRNVRGLVRKIHNYEEFLKENKDYDTKFYEVGDGMAVSKKNR